MDVIQITVHLPESLRQVDPNEVLHMPMGNEVSCEGFECAVDGLFRKIQNVSQRTVIDPTVFGILRVLHLRREIDLSFTVGNSNTQQSVSLDGRIMCWQQSVIDYEDSVLDLLL